MKTVFQIIPLPTVVAESARRTAATRRPDHETVVAASTGTCPCRHCLRWATPGEAMILFPYQSIPSDKPYGESGPIFVHKDPCERYSAIDAYPPDFREGRVVRGYNAKLEIIAAEVPTGDPEAIIETMLANPEISFLQVRSLTHGCYTMKVERV